MVTGVIGVTFWTDNLERLFYFYNDVLQLPLHSRHEDFIAFELGDIRFNIGLHSDISGVSKDPFRFMPHLGVLEIQEEAKRLTQAGVKFIRQPEQETWGGWVATFEDPDGNILQLMQLG